MTMIARDAEGEFDPREDVVRALIAHVRREFSGREPYHPTIISALEIYRIYGIEKHKGPLRCNDGRPWYIDNAQELMAGLGYHYKGVLERGTFIGKALEDCWSLADLKYIVQMHPDVTPEQWAAPMPAPVRKDPGA